MRKSVKAIGTITAMGTITFGSYLLGTTQAGTVTEVQTVTEIKEVVPDGYIPLDDGIVDMDAVVGFTASEDGLQLYFEGTPWVILKAGCELKRGWGYWLER